MNKELIERLLEQLLGVELDESIPNSGKELIGEYVIVRCRDAGVHAGVLVSYNGREVVLRDSRRLWYWKAAENKHTLSGVAEAGITDKSKIPASVGVIVLPEACEILSTTRKAETSIKGAAEYVTN